MNEDLYSTFYARWPKILYPNGCKVPLYIHMKGQGHRPMTRPFLDCESVDELDSELMSLALVSEDGWYRFNSEVNPLPE